MYTVYADGKLLYHPQMVNEGYAIANPSLTLELNKSGSFQFILPPSNNLYNYLTKLKTIITVYDEDEEIFSGRILNDEKDFYNRKSIYCEGRLAFLLDSILRPYDFSGSVSEYFTKLIDSHNEQVEDSKNFIVGNITVTDPNDYIVRSNIEYVSVWDELNDKLLNSLGGYIKIRKVGYDYYIDYLEDYEYNNNQVIEFGVNMIDITQYITAEDVFTCLVPLGTTISREILDEEGNVVGYDYSERLTIKDVNGGKDYIENDTAINLFGRITKVGIWNDVTIADNLLTKAKKYLDENMEMAVSLTVKALDLHLLNVNTSRIKVGEKLRVVSPSHNLDSYFTCTKITLKLQNPENNEYVLGSTFSTLTESQTNTNKSIELTVEQINNIKNNTDRNTEVVAEVNKVVSTIYDQYSEVTTVINKLDTTYAKIDFANVGTQAVGNLFVDNGLIKDLQIVDGRITGVLTGVTIKGDVIAGNTIFADSLILKGTDGLYYKLNESGGNLTTEQLTDEKYQNALDGSYIVAKSITANQIAGDTITGNEIKSFTITADKIQANAITGDKISVNELSAISSNLGSITGGSISINDLFKVDSKGNLFATSANITGTIYANSGTLSGFKFDSNKLTATSTKTYDFTDSDLTTIQSIITNGTTPTAAQLARYDINADGKITSMDYTLINNIKSTYNNQITTEIEIFPQSDKSSNNTPLMKISSRETSAYGDATIATVYIDQTGRLHSSGGLYAAQGYFDNIYIGNHSTDFLYSPIGASTSNGSLVKLWSGSSTTASFSVDDDYKFYLVRPGTSSSSYLTWVIVPYITAASSSAFRGIGGYESTSSSSGGELYFLRGSVSNSYATIDSCWSRKTATITTSSSSKREYIKEVWGIK